MDEMSKWKRIWGLLLNQDDPIYLAYECVERDLADMRYQGPIYQAIASENDRLKTQIMNLNRELGFYRSFYSQRK